MSLYEIHQRPALDSPVLIMAPDGWIDAGLGGATALGALLSSVETEMVASFDADDLLDHRSRRPTARIVDGVYEDLIWPEIQLRYGHDTAGHPLLVLVGPEPDHKWRAFASAVAELAGTFGVRMLVGMGAFPAPVPHTRPGSVVATATSAELAARIGVVKGTLEVPSGILVAVERRFAEAGIPAIGLWARVPHYAAGMPYPEAAVLLVEALGKVSDIVVAPGPLQEAAEATKQRLDELVANSVEHSNVVSQLEARYDADMERAQGGGSELGPEAWENLPTGDELAAEFQRFLEGNGS